MTAPNMATVTASLERSLQKCSLSDPTSPPTQNHHHSMDGSDASDADAAAFTTLELNSDISLPYRWEQFLDLKTGEIYYIDWGNGTKLTEDPRKARRFEGDFYSEEDSSDESDKSSSSSRDDYHRYEDEDEDEDNHVLVVAGCKSCLMYFMLPKTAEECPKCNGILLHFDRSENGYL
ncbi:protein CURLY FLAG LEAF 1-like [Magnolia sinica]|uniref:protein CURLY FLAG LEAF 1-like n=1 Tax=Magnolia sinica TaxID=86752 RepID=UPI00265AF421|nr:protein CURLY FLAG LEAF 1-like [Magnolia sinica]